MSYHIHVHYKYNVHDYWICAYTANCMIQMRSAHNSMQRTQYGLYTTLQFMHKLPSESAEAHVFATRGMDNAKCIVKVEYA